MSKITCGGKRIGIYFCEKGAGCRGGKVIYDRAYSSKSEADESDFDWNDIFKDASWFHFTGRTLALGENVAKITEIACIEAKKRNITISCDLNYRSKLWTKEKTNETMSKLMKYVDICISNVPQIYDVLKIKAESAEELSKLLCEKYNFKYVALTDRIINSAKNHFYSGMIYNGEEFFYSSKFNLDIVDRVGGGDAFCVGLIYSLSNDFPLQNTI